MKSRYSMHLKMTFLSLSAFLLIAGCTSEQAPPEDTPTPDQVAEAPSEPQVIKDQRLITYYQHTGEFSGMERTEDEIIRRIGRMKGSEDQLFQKLLEFYSEDCLECIEQGYKEMDKYVGNISSGPSNPKPVEIEVILDASGSMAAKINTEIKMEVAKNSISKFVASLPEQYKAGLRIYGHKGSNSSSSKEQSCNSTELISPFNKSKQDLLLSLKKVQAVGWTPIALSLKESQKDFSPNSNKLVYLVTDGVPTCEGDPVQIATELHKKGIVVSVFGFDMKNEDTSILYRIAQAGGGKYYDAKNGAQLDDVLNIAKQEYERWEAYKNQLTKDYMNYRYELVKIMDKYDTGPNSDGCFAKRMKMQDANIMKAMTYLYESGKVTNRDALPDLYEKYKHFTNELKQQQLQPFQDLIDKSKKDEQSKKQQIDQNMKKN